MAVGTPRTVINFSGERLQPEQERMTEVDRWLRVQREAIDRSSSFLIRAQSTTEPGYPWHDFQIEGDTAFVFVDQSARDAETPFLIYAHLHLMAERDELEPWLPEEDLGKTGLERELAFLGQVADVWLLGRSVYDTQSFGPLDEILYAHEAGFLRALVLETRPEEFAAEREEWLDENPDGPEEFEAWLERVFQRSEPGFIQESEAVGAGPG